MTDLTVPDSAASQNTADKPMFQPTQTIGEDAAPSPLFVHTSGAPPSNGSLDYIPSASKREQMAEGVADRSEDACHTREVVRHVGQDYLPSEVSERILKNRNSKLEEIAKRIYYNSSDDNKRFKEAVQLVSEAAQDELESPDQALRKALNIQSKGVPMTKAKARKLARKQMRE